ncbi:MAG: SRPBCC family protein [Thermoanaerobaculia bacterium]
MPHVERKGKVDAAPPEAFAFVADRGHAPEWVPNLTRVWDLEPREPQVGQRWKWEYELLGMSFEGEGEMTELEPGRRCRFRTKGLLASTWTYTVEPADGGSEVTVAVDYELPDTLWGRIGDRVAFARMNEGQAEKLIANLQRRFARR